jgi:hypothetical protein
MKRIADDYAAGGNPLMQLRLEEPGFHSLTALEEHLT